MSTLGKSQAKSHSSEDTSNMSKKDKRKFSIVSFKIYIKKIKSRVASAVLNGDWDKNVIPPDKQTLINIWSDILQTSSVPDNRRPDVKIVHWDSHCPLLSLRSF